MSLAFSTLVAAVGHSGKSLPEKQAATDVTIYLKQVKSQCQVQREEHHMEKS